MSHTPYTAHHSIYIRSSLHRYRKIILLIHQRTPCRVCIHACLRHIIIPTIVIPLQKVLLDQAVNVPLDPRHIQSASLLGGVDHLGDQLRVRNGLPRLQNTHNRGLRLVVPILGNTLMGLLVLFLGLLELYRVDFDSVLWIRKVVVDTKSVRGIDVPAFGVFGQRPNLSASKGLKSP